MVREGRRLVRLVMAGLACAPLVFLTTLTTASVGAVTPQAAILSTVGFGLTISPPGPYNGSLTSPAIAPIVDADPAIKQLVTSGELTGYIRRWDGRSSTLATVIIMLFSLPSPDAVAGFKNGLTTGLIKDSQLPMSIVPDAVGAGIPDALTFRGSASKDGVVLSQNDVVFSDRSYVVAVLTSTVNNELSPADVATIARHQWARLPGPTSGPASTDGFYQAGRVFGAFLVGVFVVGLVFVIVSRKRSRRVKAKPSPLWPTDGISPTTARPSVPFSPVPPPLTASAVGPSPVGPSAPRVAPPAPPSSARLAPESERPNVPIVDDPRTSFWDE